MNIQHTESSIRSAPALHPFWRSICILLIAVSGPVCAQEPELRLSEADAKRAAIEKPAPPYSPMARQLKITGKVEVLITIDPKGHVEDVKIVSGNAILTAWARPGRHRWESDSHSELTPNKWAVGEC